MKKLITMSIFGAALIFGFSANAQQGTFRVQAGGILGTEAAADGVGFGINAGVEYYVSDAISIAPSYDFFFEDEPAAGFTYKISSINVDGRYYMSESFYVLAGVSLATAEITLDFLGTPITGKANSTGANVGAGYNLAMGESALLNLQAKYNTTLAQVQAGVGIAFSF